MSELNNSRSLNDPRVPGQHFLATGFVELPKQHDAEADEIVKIVRKFNGFSEGKAPHCEHGFGKFEYLGKTCFWKIDAYVRDRHPVGVTAQVF